MKRTIEEIIIRKILSASATFAIMAAIFHPAMAWDTVSHDGWRFEISTPFGHKEHNYQVVYKQDGHPVRFGEKSERFEVRPGDCGTTENGGWNDCENDRERTEMSSHKNHILYNGDENWYRWSIFFPKNYEVMHPIWMTFGQFKQIGCHPVFSFNIGEYATYSEASFFQHMTGRYARAVDGAGLQTHITRNFRGKWLDIVVHAKWSHSNEGRFKFWVNGKLISDYKGKTLWCYKGIYFKYGVYRTGVSAVPEKYRHTTVYSDGIRISKSGEGMFDPLPE